MEVRQGMEDATRRAKLDKALALRCIILARRPSLLLVAAPLTTAPRLLPILDHPRHGHRLESTAGRF